MAGAGGGAAGDGFDRRARTDALEIVHDDLIARLQSRGDQPLIADGARSLEHAQLGRAVRAHDQRRRLALGVAAHRELRHQDGVRRLPSSSRARTNKPGSSSPRGFGKIARTVTEFVVAFTVTSENLQRALLRIDLAVFVDELHARLSRFRPP